MFRTLNQEFFKTWSAEMAYVLGYFAADGSMLKNKRGAHFIEFTTTDRHLVQIVKHASGASHTISVRPIRNKKWKPQYRLQIGSKEWFEDLSRRGFTQSKSNVLRFPFVPPEHMGHFVRGYFDGDGGAYLAEYYSTWHKKKVWVFTTRFTSGSEAFLRTLQKKLAAYQVRGGFITKKNRGFELGLSRHDSVALYRLMYHTGEIASLYLPRKRRVMERAIQVLKLDK